MKREIVNTERDSPIVRGFQLAELLAGHTFEGLRNVDIAQALRISPAGVTADMALLEQAGWVERVPQLPTRWRLSPRAMRIWRTHERALADRQSQLDEVDQRYSREN